MNTTKRPYSAPSVRALRLHIEQHLLTPSVDKTDGNAGIGYGGGGNGGARTREKIWRDED